ncbi:hypothetical protein [Salinibacter ruber]|uniref:hypothetical protein n=1 Tax=Salinibacter ruber TaxID=146919 RepID=UPI002169CF96|nr:hypothetical protein [Salinibacter ruber]MCS3610978.1 hypothetical protein [Salinibacter ruber]
MSTLVEFDEEDAQTLEDRTDARNDHDGPLAGDLLLLPNGETRRIAARHNAGGDRDRVQPTTSTCGSSFFLCETGRASYSGGLDLAISTGALKRTGRTKRANFWFFHHGFPGAGRGVYFNVEVPVWYVTAGADIPTRYEEETEPYESNLASTERIRELHGKE